MKREKKVQYLLLYNTIKDYSRMRQKWMFYQNRYAAFEHLISTRKVIVVVTSFL